MVVAMVDVCNDCSFAIKFADATQKEKVEECMSKGLAAWYAATDPEKYDGDYFTQEEVEGFYWSGYAEPTLELLKKHGIDGDVVDIEYDENGCVINADESFYY